MVYLTITSKIFNLKEIIVGFEIVISINEKLCRY